MKARVDLRKGAHFLTTYTDTYTEKNRLWTVTMTRPTGTQTRTFTYDANGKVLTAANPETGTVSNTYDSRTGLLQQKLTLGIAKEDIMKRYFSAFALTVILVRGACAQGDRPDQALRDLKPLAERLLKALDENDFNASNQAFEEIARALQKARPVPVSKKAMLAELEASVQGDRKTRELMLADFALFAEEAEENEKARQYAYEALEVARKGGSLGSRNTYYGNLVLGLLALREQNPQVAGRRLLASFDDGVWPTFDLAGPNLKLGKRLIEARETEVVVEYLERCKRYWPSGRKRLKDWQAVIRAGVIPDFSVNGLR